MANQLPVTFGCERCWPADADAAWEARRQLTRVVTLVDTSHFSVRIAACAGCGQQFLSVFTEQIDWEDGEDPQSFTLLPLRDDEAAALVAEGENVSDTRLEQLAPGRRSLRQDWPKGGSEVTFWASGVVVGPHD